MCSGLDNLVTNITFVVVEITFKIAVITSPVAKIPFFSSSDNLQSGCDHFFGGQYDICSG